MMKPVCDIAGLACLLALSTPLRAQDAPAPATPPARAAASGVLADDVTTASAPEEMGEIDAASTEAVPDGQIDFSADSFEMDEGGNRSGSNTTHRATFAHELSRRFGSDGELVNNRTSARLEYSTFFRESFYARLDGKLNAYWSNDHKARGKSMETEVITSEAFLQYSRQGGATSLKVGVQKLIWGESEGGAITDEVSPRNFSELFFIPLEESRLGQGMVVFDYFSPVGDWSMFYVPTPRFNDYPERGTAYFVDAFGESAIVRDRRGGARDDEFGMRWRRTFGQSDVSVMAARLTENDYAYRLDGIAPDGRLLIARVPQRMTMLGSTFSFTRGKSLVKGEVALKSSRAFNDRSLGLVEKDVLDSAIGLTYSLGQNNTLGVEWVNSRILGWNRGISGVPENAASLVINANFLFHNDRLSVNWLTIWSEPYASYQSSLRSAYKWDDNLSFGIDLHYVDAPDRRSGLRPYRDEDQVVVRVQYQF